jgi:hypothetical protein
MENRENSQISYVFLEGRANHACNAGMRLKKYVLQVAELIFAESASLDI